MHQVSAYYKNIGDRGVDVKGPSKQRVFEIILYHFNADHLDFMQNQF